jgi:hypothetical protein
MTIGHPGAAASSATPRCGARGPLTIPRRPVHGAVGGPPALVGERPATLHCARAGDAPPGRPAGPGEPQRTSERIAARSLIVIVAPRMPDASDQSVNLRARVGTHSLKGVRGHGIEAGRVVSMELWYHRWFSRETSGGEG